MGTSARHRHWHKSNALFLSKQRPTDQACRFVELAGNEEQCDLVTSGARKSPHPAKVKASANAAIAHRADKVEARDAHAKLAGRLARTATSRPG